MRDSLLFTFRTLVSYKIGHSNFDANLLPKNSEKVMFEAQANIQ